MSDDLRALVRRAVAEETAAADREFPYSPDVAGRVHRDIRRRRTVGATVLAVGGLAVATLATLGMGIWEGTPTPPAVTETPSPTPTSPPSPPDWDSLPFTDLEDLEWFDPDADPADWACGGRPSATPAMGELFGWFVQPTDLEPDGTAQYAVRAELYRQGVEPPDPGLVVEHPATARLVLLRDGVVVAEGAAPDPERVRTFLREQVDVTHDAAYALRLCDGSGDPVPYGRYEGRLVEELAVFSEDGGPGDGPTPLPVAVLAVSDPIPIAIEDWSQPPRSGFSPLDVGGSYRRAAEELELPDGTQLGVGTLPTCGPAPQIQAFDSRGGGTAARWLRPWSFAAPADVVQDLTWDPLSAAEADVAGVPTGLTLNRFAEEASGTDATVDWSEEYVLLDGAGHVVATGGSALDRENLGAHLRITVPFTPCDGGTEVAPGTYTAMWVGGSLSNPDYWPEARAILGLGNVAHPGWLYSYAVIGDVTVP